MTGFNHVATSTVEQCELSGGLSQIVTEQEEDMVAALLPKLSRLTVGRDPSR